MKRTYLDLEGFKVYQKGCRLPIEGCGPDAQKHDDRRYLNKIEGIQRSRDEAAETAHHLFIEKLKGCLEPSVYASFRSRYKERIRMLNGLEKSLVKHLPESERRWIE